MLAHPKRKISPVDQVRTIEGKEIPIITMNCDPEQKQDRKLVLLDMTLSANDADEEDKFTKVSFGKHSHHLSIYSMISLHNSGL